MIPVDNSADKEAFAICTTGTLGDHLMVLCKAYHIHKTTGRNVDVYPFSDYTSYENSIRRLFEATTFIRIADSVRPFNDLVELIEAGTNPGPHVNSTALPEVTNVENGLPPDPNWVQMDPYPEFHISSESVASGSVVIQLNGGGPHNPRGFDIEWVEKLSRRLNEYQIDVCVVGTGDGYTPEQLRRLSKTEYLDSFVGKTDFDEWLATLAGAKAVVTLEGFAAFFALANGVKTAIFNQYPHWVTENSLHHSWLKHTRLRHLQYSNKYARRLRRYLDRFTRKSSAHNGLNHYHPKGISQLVRYLVSSDGG